VKHGVIRKIRSCNKCLAVLGKHAGKSCADGHAFTCCGGKEFHVSGCEKCPLYQAGRKAGLKHAAEYWRSFEKHFWPAIEDAVVEIVKILATAEPKGRKKQAKRSGAKK
jgi:hypothetical protein